MNYVLWYDGKESELIPQADLRRQWLMKELPKGCLWRRSTETDWRTPESLADEFQLFAPPPLKPAQIPPLPAVIELAPGSVLGDLLIVVGFLGLGIGLFANRETISLAAIGCVVLGGFVRVIAVLMAIHQRLQLPPRDRT